MSLLLRVVIEVYGNIYAGVLGVVRIVQKGPIRLQGRSGKKEPVGSNPFRLFLLGQSGNRLADGTSMEYTGPCVKVALAREVSCPSGSGKAVDLHQ
jgi:hypothetical protein